MSHSTSPFQPLWSGQLIVSGSQSKELLQGQLTCDVTKLSEGKPSFGAHCNRQGKVISLFQIALQDDRYCLYMPPELVPTALAALNKYAVFYKGISLINASDSSTRLPSPLDAIRQGIPALYPDTSEQFFAHELDLPALNAVSFDKGCYTGQEIIARMHYRGKAKTRLYLGTHSSTLIPTRNSDIFSATGACGTVIDYAASGTNQYAILFTAPIMGTDSFFMDEALTLPLYRADQRSTHVR